MSHGPRRAPRALMTTLAAAACAAAALGAATASASASTTWLCKPGLKSNPCAMGLGTTVISPTGETEGTLTPAQTKSPKIDCFYVYPTVSDQKTMQATRRIDPEERSIALYQAARYSSECRIYAPMYRQITLAGLLKPDAVTAKMRASAYADVRDAWRDYLKHDNKGRGVVFIGHSQGTFVLRQLIAQEVDKQAAVRKRMVSALLLGGNVLVKKGKKDGGDFQHLKACTSATQLRCVVAFSTFNAAPPETAVFGRAGEGRSVVAGQSTAGTEVLCTNPAALAGGSAPLTSLYPSAPFAPGSTIGALTTQVGLPTPSISTPWIEAQAFSGQCTSTNGINVLTITGVTGAPSLKTLPDATWGLHLVDANIALGNLVTLVHGQVARYTAH
ncbi:MAG TPA: DUF3089 domain-containing protein [Baekduia sp.]|uniref:DUF3089 domain-containing protein n=1 Tax=Baekduia sp. TaxID=2600305 RepID=UPI002C0754E2|nr:DUF3089 domain-containing protein [Baekduia sp.]HMJ32770.1 DUF3089 domain-containing protein [Baekduia sp.]